MGAVPFARTGYSLVSSPPCWPQNGFDVRVVVSGTGQRCDLTEGPAG